MVICNKKERGNWKLRKSKNRKLEVERRRERRGDNYSVVTSVEGAAHWKTPAGSLWACSALAQMPGTALEAHYNNNNNFNFKLKGKGELLFW